ncbi:MAG TPA: IDEAL domain-containing protein [Firmicutes bacterium]|uniref:YpiB family protein n=1 Tax=Capillibacterium thermochitinicola TaxID=2699427 RepID=A0A8J6LLV7_9FIRM|nr:YpiB family protein [Capillibacterium thermochitinicola]MBA2132844.1 YpiB family protein [Capillibacterium thermochitinicola]HHW11662.1 IDEAL domain-containing protein [Bacillota bacterium]
MKQPLVSPLAKKAFIQWFLTNCEFRGEAPRRILLALLKEESTLKRIKIVRHGSILRPLLVVSSLGTGMPPAVLLTYNLVLTDPDDVLEYLSSTGNDCFYLTFYFPERDRCLSFRDVLEELPLPVEPEKVDSLQMDLELKLVLIEAENEEQRTKLLAQIDEALAKKEKKTFLRLARLLKSL